MVDAADPQDAFLERLRSAVRASGLPKGQLAKKAKISRQYLYDLEKGDPELSVAVAHRLARALGTTVSALLGEQPPAVPAGAREAAEELAGALPGLTRSVERLRAALGQTGPASRDRVIPFPTIGPDSNVDLPQELRTTELPVVAYAAAGKDRHVEPIETGETIAVPNPQARRALAQGSKVVKVVGDSMEPNYDAADFVIVEPARDEIIQDGDVCYVIHEGQAMLKVLRFTRNKLSGKMERLTLVSLNTRYPPVPVYPDDEFRVLGVEAYHVARGKSFR